MYHPFKICMVSCTAFWLTDKKPKLPCLFLADFHFILEKSKGGGGCSATGGTLKVFNDCFPGPHIYIMLLVKIMFRNLINSLIRLSLLRLPYII